MNNPNPKWWVGLGDITSPTLIVGGGSSSHIPQHKLQEVSEAIPNCQFITVEGAGHGVHQTKTAEFLSAIEDFLGIG